MNSDSVNGHIENSVILYLLHDITKNIMREEEKLLVFKIISESLTVFCILYRPHESIASILLTIPSAEKDY